MFSVNILNIKIYKTEFLINIVLRIRLSLFFSNYSVRFNGTAFGLQILRNFLCFAILYNRNKPTNLEKKKQGNS